MKPLSRRDRTALAIGAASVMVFVLFRFVVFPLVDGRQRLEKNVRNREKAIVRMRAMQEKYKKLHARSNSLASQLSRRPANFSLFAFLEQKAAAAGVKESIAYMKPSAVESEGVLQQAMVEMKLKGISLQQLVGFLKLVESPENIVGVRRISIQEKVRDKAATLDVIMQVVSLEKMAQETS